MYFLIVYKNISSIINFTKKMIILVTINILNDYAKYYKAFSEIKSENNKHFV
jgi:hypothetical protein